MQKRQRQSGSPVCEQTLITKTDDKTANKTAPAIHSRFIRLLRPADFLRRESTSLTIILQFPTKIPAFILSVNT